MFDMPTSARLAGPSLFFSGLKALDVIHLSGSSRTAGETVCVMCLRIIDGPTTLSRVCALFVPGTL